MIKYVYSNSSLRLFPFWELKGFIFDQGAHKEQTRSTQECAEKKRGRLGMGDGSREVACGVYLLQCQRALPPFIAPFLALCLSDIRVTCVLRMQAPSSA